MHQNDLKSRADRSDELACQAQAGSVAAYARLVGMYQRRLYNFLLRRTGSAADAEDLTQETLIRAWQQIKRYRSGKRFSTWLYTIAIRLSISDQRRQATRDKHERSAGEHRASAIDSEVGGRGRESAEYRSLWDAAGQLLSSNQQTALYLRYAEDLPVKDIARVLGITRISARVALHRARQTLAEHLGGLDAQSGQSRRGDEDRVTQVTGQPSLDGAAFKADDMQRSDTAETVCFTVTGGV